MLKVTVLFLLVSFSACEVCDDVYSIDISNGTHLKNGDIIYKEFTYKRHEYFKKGASFRGCICNKKICLLKCCPFGYGYNFKIKKCVEMNDAFNPPVYDNYANLQDIDAMEYFHFNFSKPNCSDGETRIEIKQIYNDIHMRKDGKLYVKVPSTIPPFMLLEPDKYCVDTFINEDEEGEVSKSFDALLCFATDQDSNHYVLSSTCMIISCVFILATVAVYGWLPELRNLHGRVLMAYLLCLFVGFAFLAAMQILLVIDNITNDCCIVFTIIIYFSLESAFFWLNIMCFDIWWTFSGKRGMSMEKLSVRAKFRAYSIYAFGIPTALTIILVALEFSDLPPHVMLPLLRRQGCFLYGYSRLIYLYGPMVILWFANLVFFILTAVKITQIKKQTSVLKTGESATHDRQSSERQRLLLYVKLFIVMGVNWVLEVISALYPKADEFWRFTDAYNVLIGLIIFIIFVLKRKIFRLMKKRIKNGIQHKNGTVSVMQTQRHQTYLQDCKQRDSIETIRTYCADSDSNKGVNTTIL